MDKQEIINLIGSKEYAKAKEAILKLLTQDKDDIELIKYLGLCNINLGLEDEALENFKKVCEVDKNDALSLYYISAIYISKGNYDEAESILKNLINIREGYWDAYKNLAVIYSYKHDLAKLTELEKKLSEYQIEDAEIYDIYSSAFLKNMEFDKSVLYLNKAISLDVDNYKYYLKLGTVYFAAGNLEKAVENYKKALDLKNDDAQIYYNIGMVYFASEKIDKAFEYLKKAYETEKTAEYLNAYALSALKGNFPQEAVNAYTELLKMYPDKENFRYNLACAYDLNNETDKAIDIIERLITFNVNSVQLKLHLAALYTRKGIDEGAKLLYADIIEMGLADNNILYEYSVLCAKTGETDKAEQILKKIIETEPNFAIAYKDLAIIYLSRKFFDRALEYFKKAYETEPDNIYIIYEYGNYYQMMSDFNKASEMYEKLLKYDDITIGMLVSTGKNYISLNKIDKAKEIFLKAIEKEPQNIEVLYNLAQIYNIEKNYTNARQLLEDAYTLAPNSEIGNLLANVCMEMGDYNQAYALFNLVNIVVPDNISVIMNMADCKYKQKDYETAKNHLKRVLELLPQHEDALELMKKIENGD